MAKAKKTASTTAKAKKPAKKVAKTPAAKKTTIKKQMTDQDNPKSTPVTIDRREPKTDERRKEEDRRTTTEPVAEERRTLERREKVTRRRQIDPTTCERDYTDDEVEFMQAIDEYKRRSGRMFPTCSEILEVLRDLGYTRPGMIIAQDETDSKTTPEGDGSPVVFDTDIEPMEIASDVAF